jgi:hypothetical protein
MALVCVDFGDMEYFEVEVRADILHVTIEDQNLPILKNDAQKVLLPSAALHYLQHS